MNREFDVIVVGGGHAGIEAAHAAARIGARAALVTLERAAIGRMSCNPAIGGLGKSHLVAEVDALGGLMARATDATGIQFRTLNRSKGPAVQALRAQCDMDAYSLWMRSALERTPRLTILEGEAVEILVRNGRIAGVVLAPPANGGGGGGERAALACRALILTTGTFLDGLLHFGLERREGGRFGERAATRLPASFAALGLETGRLKTGTPARLRRDSIDWSRTERQDGDEPPLPFSLRTARLEVEQVPCYLTRTNARTHEIIRASLDRSPLYTGVIHSVGPRYCPSIEDKVVRYPERDSHQVFLEPETRHGQSIYPNGVSTSLPPDAQEAFLRSIPGLERCELLRPGYAVEYTFTPAHQLRPTLEAKDVPGLFLAGQINGTSGYEEAAAQGILAGINAALGARGEPPLTFGRDEAYLGVLVDDLITKTPREPYRMFTSRAERRLLLRPDNADLRLAAAARRVGMLSEREFEAVARYREAVEREVGRLEAVTLRPSELDPAALARLGIPAPEKSLRLAQFLARPEVTYEALAALGLAGPPRPDFGPLLEDWERERGADGEADFFAQAERDWLAAMAARGAARAAAQVEIAVKYAGYLRRELDEVERARRMEETALPLDFAYREVRGLRREAADLLSRVRPATLAQAGRIAGVTPADVALLQIHLRARG